MRILNAFFASLILFLVVLGCVRPPKAARADSPELTVTVDQLSTEFKQNLTAARLKYSRRTVAVTGTIKDRLNQARTLVFEHPEKGVSVQCFFKNEDTASYNNSRDGKQYTYLGVVGIGSEDFLAIADCKLMN
jgi:hypothetical protein